MPTRKNCRLSYIVLILLCLPQILSAQSARPSSPPVAAQSTRPTGPQWEYLVISFGKTYFSDPNAEPETKTKGLSKLISYSRIGVVSATEALTVEWQMDTLGKFGWELVGIVGAIGGDQQMVFRRRYDPTQSRAEAALIREEGERLLATQRQLASDLAQADFVDLDEVERIAAIAQTRQTEETRLRSAIDSLRNPAINNVKIVSTASAPNGSAVRAEVTVDGSVQLLREGNKYRSQEAQTLSNQIAAAIYSAAGLISEYGAASSSNLGYSLGEVKISVSISVSNQGKQKTVATAVTGGKWPERKRGF